MGDADLEELLSLRRAKRARVGGTGGGEEDALQRGVAWREAATPPTKLAGGRSPWDVTDGEEMREEVCLEMVYGTSVGSGRGLMGFLASGETCYVAGRIVVVGEEGGGGGGRQRHMVSHGGGVTAMGLHPSGEVVCTGDEGGEVLVWESGGSMEVMARLAGGGGGVRCMQCALRWAETQC